MIIESAVRSCADTGGAGPCWQFVPGENTCTGQTVEWLRIPPRRRPPGSRSPCSARCAWRACPTRPAGAPDPTSLSWSANLICGMPVRARAVSRARHGPPLLRLAVRKPEVRMKVDGMCWSRLVSVAPLGDGQRARPLAARLAAGGAPGSPIPSPLPTPVPIRPRTSRYLASNRNVDLLFLIDDSSSMRLSQDNLTRNFPVLMNTLQNLPGGLPNVHIGVISSDMGAGDGSVAGCDSTGGKNGIFQYTARGTCTSTGLAAGATYISDIGGVRNYTGNLADVFTCIAAIGETRLRLRASVRRDHARARRRRARRAGGEPGLPAPRRLPGDRHDHERGRLLRDARRAALRHRLEHQHLVAARSADQLPLQRVRPPVRRRRGQPRHTRTATRPTTT